MNSKTKDELINHKKISIKKLNSLLETYINSNNPQLQKKADLISYWITTFSDFVLMEEEFDPTRIISYSRGSVVRVNFGFNIGGEMGGLHYAVVLDNDNKHRAGVVTVVPLSSTDGKSVHPRSVDLGSELYTKIRARQDSMISDAQEELDSLLKVKSALDSLSAVTNKLEDFIEAHNEISRKIDKLNSMLDTLNKNGVEISRLKSGSMAVTNQITTISKQRIYTPKKSEDYLYGITLSESALEKINNKIKELYLR